MRNGMVACSDNILLHQTEDMWPECLPIECTIFPILEGGPRFYVDQGVTDGAFPLKDVNDLPRDNSYNYRRVVDTLTVVPCEGDTHFDFFTNEENRAKLGAHLGQLVSKSRTQRSQKYANEGSNDSNSLATSDLESKT